MTGEFPGGPVVMTLTSTAGEQVQSLVRELTSPHGMDAPTPQKKEERKKMTYFSVLKNIAQPSTCFLSCSDIVLALDLGLKNPL